MSLRLTLFQNWLAKMSPCWSGLDWSLELYDNAFDALLGCDLVSLSPTPNSVFCP